VIDKQFERIEKRTRQDRDRNAFGEELMALFYQVFARSGLRHAIDGQRIIVEAARPCWQGGHPLLSQIAETCSWSPWPSALSDPLFGNEFFARVHEHDPARSLEYQETERRWLKEGRKALPGYFRSFGVTNAIDYAADLRRRALEDQKQRHQRPPTGASWIPLKNSGLNSKPPCAPSAARKLTRPTPATAVRSCAP
jgi:hypothetical protein